MEKKNLGISIVHTIKGHFSQQGPIFKKLFSSKVPTTISILFLHYEEFSTPLFASLQLVC
jgi:hypothetical protein